MPGERAIEAWRALRDRRDAGWWPIVIGSAEDERRLVEAAGYNDAAVDDVLRSAADLDPDRLFAEWRATLSDDYEGVADDEDLIGVWPEGEVPPSSYTLPFEVGSGRPHPTILALVPAREPTDVPAVLAWGAWNECPAPEAHVAVHRRWAERYGAELVGISGDVIEMRVARPPRSRMEAMALAQEQFAYCSDIVLQGTETISGLAATLLDAEVWFFWWD